MTIAGAELLDYTHSQHFFDRRPISEADLARVVDALLAAFHR